MSFEVEWHLPTKIVYFSEVGKQESGYQKEPRIISVSELKRAINFSKSFENSAATITFENADYFFEKLLSGENQYISGNKIVIKDSGTIIFTGKISEVPPPSNLSMFEIRVDVNKSSMGKKPNKKLTLDDFQNIPDENKGKYGNIIGGSAVNSSGATKGILTAYRVDNNKFLAAWHHLKAITGVYKSDETNITSLCTLQNSTDGNAYIIYTSTDPEIFFNANGMMDNFSNLIQDPAKILGKIISDFSDFIIDGISDASTIFYSRGYSSGASVIVIDDGISWSEVFKRFSNSFDCLIFTKASGNLGIKVLDWGTETAIKKIYPVYVDHKTFKNWKDIKEIVNEYQRMYWYHFREDFFQRTPQDIKISSNWDAKDSELRLYYIKDDIVAMDVTTRVLFIKKKPIIWYEFSIPKKYGNDIDLGDIVNFRYTRGIYKNAWRMVQIFRKVYGKNYKNTIKFEGFDITGINSGLIVLLDDTNTDIVLLKNENDESCHVLL